MHRIAAALMIMAAPGAFAYTAAELAAKNVAAKGGSEPLGAIHTLRVSGKLLVNGGTLEMGYALLVGAQIRPVSLDIAAVGRDVGPVARDGALVTCDVTPVAAHIGLRGVGGCLRHGGP